MTKNIQKGLLVVGALAAVSGPAMADGIDTTGIVTTISTGATAISAIGVAVLSIFALAKCYQLIKKAF